MVECSFVLGGTEQPVPKKKWMRDYCRSQLFLGDLAGSSYGDFPRSGVTTKGLKGFRVYMRYVGAYEGRIRFRVRAWGVSQNQL